LNWPSLDVLLAECQKLPGATAVPVELNLGDYADVLKRFNGCEGFVTPEQYLVLWSVEQISELNAAYRVADYASGIVLLGTDGGDTGYGRDKATGRFGSVPLIGMSRASFKEMGDSFEDFLRLLARE
jgi:hypothetical protein